MSDTEYRVDLFASKNAKAISRKFFTSESYWNFLSELVQNNLVSDNVELIIYSNMHDPKIFSRMSRINLKNLRIRYSK